MGGAPVDGWGTSAGLLACLATSYGQATCTRFMFCNDIHGYFTRF